MPLLIEAASYSQILRCSIGPIGLKAPASNPSGYAKKYHPGIFLRRTWRTSPTSRRTATTRAPRSRLDFECMIPLLVLLLLLPLKGFAFLDWVGEQAKKAAEAAAYADAASELAGEISPNEDLKRGAEEVNKRAERLRSKASEINYLSRSTTSALQGPEWSSKRLETNIRNTTDYVRRLKRLIGRIAILGTEGAIALNTTETNVSLNEVQKNQQALLLQNEDRKLREIEKEEETRQEWRSFATNQRRLRTGEATDGKLH